MDSVRATELLMELRSLCKQVAMINDCPDMDCQVELAGISFHMAKVVEELDLGLSQGGEFPNPWRLAGSVESSLRKKVDTALEMIARGAVELSELLEWKALRDESPENEPTDKKPVSSSDYGF